MFEDRDNDHAQRFAKKTAEASLNYANASAFAGVFAFNALLETWTDAYAEATSPSKPGSKSWFRNPTKADLYDPWGFGTLAGSTTADPWLLDIWSGYGGWMTHVWSPIWWTSSTSPFTAAWSEFLPKPFSNTDLSFTRSPFWDTATSALPMTWSLMSFGIPHEVAKPTAEANTAALEAFDSAQQVASDHIAAYTSALESVTDSAVRKPMGDQNPDLFENFGLLFWPWLSAAPASDTSTAA